MASREVFWNIYLGDLVFPLGAVLVALVAFAIYRRVRLWMVGGRDDKRLKGLPTRFWSLFVKTKADMVWHKRIFRSPYAGMMHGLIFGGFAILFMGTSLDTINEHVYRFLEGNIYLVFSLTLDVGGLMVLSGVGMAAYRRYVLKPQKLDNIFDDAVALSLIAVIIVSGFVVEGLRIAETELEAHPGWAVWSPVGYVFARAFNPLGQDVLLGLHQGVWWGHMLVSFGGIAYVFVGFTRLGHILASPLNMFLRNSGPKGVLQPIDLEAEELGTLGAAKLQDLTWKDLLDLDACTRCGRCQELCPAAMTHKPLSPKKLIQELKAHMVTDAQALVTGKRNGRKDEKEEEAAAPAMRAMIGEVVSEDELWSCTTCAACEEACPVYIEPVVKIIQMRRNLVLEQGSIPATMMASLRSTQDRGHPWKGASASRTDWAADLTIENLSSGGESDILFWVGCTGGVMETAMGIPAAFAKVLAAAQVKIGYLGHEESCCGHFQRRIGDEYLFQCQAQANIETLKAHNVRKIITTCPHCYHTLKYEYPQFGGDFEVLHYTEFLLRLIKEGKLEIKKGMNVTVAYQDPCYLGRYHEIYKAPRELLEAIPGVRLLEMEHCYSNSLCCGAGGGRMWMEEEPDQRVNRLRAQEAVDTGAKVVITACPFCLQMFQDGLGGLGLEEEERPHVMDLVEFLMRAIFPAEVKEEAAVAQGAAGAAEEEVLTEIAGN